MVKRSLLHEQIAATLREEIQRCGRPGQRLDADTKQTARFGVSVVTVREALRLLCQEGLLERRHGSGTYVTDRCRRPRVAVVSRAGTGDSPAFFYHRRVLDCAVEALKAAGTDSEVILEPGILRKAPSPSCLAGLVAEAPGRLQGVVTFLCSADAAAVAAVERAGVPVVGHDESHYPYFVTNDHRAIIRESVRLLVGHGRRRIAFMQPGAGGPGTQPGEWYLLDEFRAALAEAGVRFRREWVCSALDPLTPGSGWDHFHGIWRGRKEKPDGMLVGLDTVFPETAMAVLSLGISVPRDLLVVTHASAGSGMFYPFPVVRLEFDARRHAEAAVRMLMQRLRGEPTAEPNLYLPFVTQGTDVVEQALRRPPARRSLELARSVARA